MEALAMARLLEKSAAKGEEMVDAEVCPPAGS
jgi:hypothetical protein